MAGLFARDTHNPSGSRIITPTKQAVAPSRGRAVMGAGVFSGNSNTSGMDVGGILRFGASPYALNRLRELAQKSTLMKSFFQMAKRGVLNSQPISPLMASLRPEATRERVLALWREFEKAPTTLGRPTMLEVQEGLIESVLTDGMAFFLKRNNRAYAHGFALLPLGREFLMENYTLLSGTQNPVVAGFEFDRQTGQLVAFRFAKSLTEVWRRHDPHRTLFAENVALDSTMVRVPVSQVIAVMTSERHDELVSRYPQAVLGLQTAQGLDVIDKATITAMKNAAKVAGVITKDKDAPIDDDASEDEAAQMDELLARQELPDGSFIEFPAGYDLDAFKNDWPNLAGDIGRKAILRNLSSVMGISYAELANDAEASNFANTRTFSILTRERWRRVAVMLTQQFVQPVMEAWLDAVELQGLIPSLRPSQRRAILTTNFSIRAWQSVDPFKDANAAQIRLGQFATSPQRILAESGETIDSILDDFQDLGRKIRERDEANNGDLTRGLRFLAAFQNSPAIASLEVENPENGETSDVETQQPPSGS